MHLDVKEEEFAAVNAQSDETQGRCTLVRNSICWTTQIPHYVPEVWGVITAPLGPT